MSNFSSKKFKMILFSIDCCKKKLEKDVKALMIIQDFHLSGSCSVTTTSKCVSEVVICSFKSRKSEQISSLIYPLNTFIATSQCSALHHHSHLAMKS